MKTLKNKECPTQICCKKDVHNLPVSGILPLVVLPTRARLPGLVRGLRILGAVGRLRGGEDSLLEQVGQHLCPTTTCNSNSTALSYGVLGVFIFFLPNERLKFMMSMM